MKRLIVILFLSGFLIPFANAYDIYPVGGLFKAVFPNEPTFAFSTDEGAHSVQGYRSVDEDKELQFLASFTDGKKYSNTSGLALYSLVKGLALSQAGHVTEFKNILHKGYDSAIFSIQILAREYPQNWNGICALKEGQHLCWIVVDFIGVSAVNGKRIFNSYLDHFTVLD